MRVRAKAHQTRRDNLGVIQHENIPRPQKLEQVPYVTVRDFADLSIDNQQTCVAPIGQRMLGNQLFR